MRTLLRPARSIAAALLLTGALAAPARAQLDLGDPTMTPFLAGNIGFLGWDRGVYFRAITDFSIFSAGIKFEALQGGATEIMATIREGFAGPTRGNVLASGTTVINNVGLDFYDVPLTYDFIAGNFYDISFEDVGGPDGWGNNGINSMEFYSFDSPTSPSYTVGGIVEVIDGGCFPSQCREYGNTVMPHVRFDAAAMTVPEPGTYALLAVGLGAMALVGRRRRS